FFQAEDGIRDRNVTGVQTCALPICLRQLAAENLHRSWLTIPAVTHQDEADVTALEQFRRAENKRSDEGANLTLLAFLLKACAERSEERRVGKECRLWRVT